MLKLSEFVPATSALMQARIATEFDVTELTAVTGGADISTEFSRLPFDHLMLTGSTATGRHIQRAAAEHLVPVTLELGGKSPVVIAPTADMRRVADRVMAVKTLNAGQLCLTPDYVLVPRGMESTLVQAITETTARFFPTLVDNDDYSSVLSQRHFDRLLAHLDDAREKGAEVIEINPADEDFATQRAHKMPPTLLVHVSDDMTVMQEEIFGPLLPIEPYEGIDDAIARINRRPKPLAAYYFGPDDHDRRVFLERTSSGGVTINDIMTHYILDDLPFGGVGDSGTGRYRGRAGFETFSNGRAVLSAPGWFSPNSLLAAPYGRQHRWAIKALLRWERRSVRRRLGC
jgi:coniferyl-aldehyde dehydrogenase